MREWNFQWEEVQPSERKTSQVFAEGECASSSRINCLLVLLGPEGHKELATLNSVQGRGKQSSYSQVIYPDRPRITGIYSSNKESGTEHRLSSTASDKELLSIVHVIASSSTPETPFQSCHESCFSDTFTGWVSGQGPILHWRNTPHRSGQNNVMDPAGAVSNTEPSNVTKGKSGISSSGNQYCKLCHAQGLWRYMTGSLGDSV